MLIGIIFAILFLISVLGIGLIITPPDRHGGQPKSNPSKYPPTGTKI